MVGKPWDYFLLAHHPWVGRLAQLFAVEDFRITRIGAWKVTRVISYEHNHGLLAK
jgi:hypothetical protein